MSESVTYYLVDIDSVSDALRGASAAFNRLVGASAAPIVTKLLVAMRTQTQVAMDLPPLSEEPWQSFAELARLVAQAVRLDTEEVGWDAWEGYNRVLIPLMDWNPIDRVFATHWVSRPLAPLAFEARDALPLEARTAYTEAWPHGYFRRSEYSAVIPSLHQFIDQTWTHLLDGESPLQTVRPGQPIPGKNHPLLDDDDEPGVAWQLTRAIPLYNALCAAAAKNKDLFALGY